MPTGATVEQQVMADLLSSVRAINGGPTYNKSVAFAREQQSDVFEVEALPAVLLVHSETTYDDSRLGIIECNMDVVAVLAVQAEGDWAASLRLLASDVSNKLREDWTRGGIAVTTQVRGLAIFDADEVGSVSVASAQMLVSVYFRHLYADTTSAQ